MLNLTEADWNFFADLARLEKLAKSGGKDEAEAREKANSELMRMCVWEYARECPPLRNAISGLRDAVGNLLGLEASQDCALKTLEAIETEKIPVLPPHRGVLAMPGSTRYRAQSKPVQKRALSYHDFAKKWKRLLEVVDDIVGRFNWHFLCSSEFPDKPWLEPNSECEIKRSGMLFAERSEGLDRSPVVSRFSGDFAEYFRRQNRAVLDELERFFVKLMTEQYERFESTGFECWVIPDQVFEIFEPEEIASSLRRLCHLRDPHRLVPSDVTNDEFKREYSATYLTPPMRPASALLQRWPAWPGMACNSVSWLMPSDRAPGSIGGARSCGARESK